MRGKGMGNNEIKLLIKKYLELDFNDFFIFNKDVTAYIPNSLQNGNLLCKHICTDCLVIFLNKPSDDTVLFRINESLWYIGCFVDKNNNLFKPSEFKKILNSENFLNDIKNKEHIGGVRGYECYETLEELLMGF